MDRELCMESIDKFIEQNIKIKSNNLLNSNKIKNMLN